MPKTLRYRPILIDQLITNERINSYRKVFRPTNDIELMGVYLWNTHVSGTFYPIISLAEITLRNAIDQTLQAHLGRFWWKHSRLRYRSFKPDTAPPLSVQKLSDSFRWATHKYISAQRYRYNITGSIKPHHNGVVAQTEFSTWEHILGDEFMGDNLIWPSQLGTVFAGTWPNTHAGTVLTFIRDLVTTVREFRNRLFHHEPVWKKFGVNTESDALLYLREKIVKIENLVALIHPENLKLLERNRLLDTVRRACTSQEIRRFQYLAATHDISSMEKLRTLVELCGAENITLTAKLDFEYPHLFLISPC